MHESSYIGMGKHLQKHCADLEPLEITVLDIGSLDVNGSYKPLMPPAWSYLGVDLRDGPNVDRVMWDEFTIPVRSETMDIIISGQCLEHCSNPFRLIRDAARTLKPGGTIILVAPFLFPEHGEPTDCFRFLPDGMRAILEDADLVPVDAYMDMALVYKAGRADCWAIGRKPNGST
jgi:SAM-dependent methyltransferase